MKMQYKELQIKVKDLGENSIQAIFSSDNEDRHGEVVVQSWDLKTYRDNPIILNSHNHGDASEVIGKVTDIFVKDGKLQGTIQFAVNENPKAKVIYELYKGGYLNAFSVGFSLKKLEYDEGEDNWKLIPKELLEISAVSVPANADALVEAKSKGIDVELLNNKQKEDDGTDYDDSNDESGSGDKGTDNQPEDKEGGKDLPEIIDQETPERGEIDESGDEENNDGDQGIESEGVDGGDTGEEGGAEDSGEAEGEGDSEETEINEGPGTEDKGNGGERLLKDEEKSARVKALLKFKGIIKTLSECQEVDAGENFNKVLNKSIRKLMEIRKIMKK